MFFHFLRCHFLDIQSDILLIVYLRLRMKNSETHLLSFVKLAVQTTIIYHFFFSGKLWKLGEMMLLVG